MSDLAGRFLYGTSSWSEPSWVGSFYPAGMKPGEFLSFYATQFSTVEADNTYYAIPSRELVRGWERKTPESSEESASARICAGTALSVQVDLARLCLSATQARRGARAPSRAQ